MTADQTLVILGASLAGAKAAEGARQSGFDGRIVLIGDEETAPYERPPLSKAVLRGEAPPDSTRVHPDGFYAEHDIDLRTDHADRIDPERRTVRLAGGDEVRFDSAVIATGAEPRALTVPGAELDGVLYLRSVGDSLRLQSAIRGASRVAVIGAGWIGSEVAASARQMGADVVLVEPAPTPLYGVLGERIGGVFAKLHADHGVELRLGTGLRELRGTSQVDEIVLDDDSGRARGPGRGRSRRGATHRARQHGRVGHRQRHRRRPVPRDQFGGHLRGRRRRQRLASSL